MIVKTVSKRELGSPFEEAFAKWLESQGGKLVAFDVDGPSVVAVFEPEEKPKK